MKNFLEKKYWLVFLALSVLIFLPSWKSGYLFFLDWPVQPFLGWRDISFWDHSLARAIYLLGGTIFFFGMWQKIMLFLIVFFFGVGGWKLAEVVLKKKSDDSALGAKFFGGFLMIFNPFVYARLADGQYGVAASILFALYLVIYLLRYFENGSRRNFVWAALFASFAVMFSMHAIFFVLAIVIAFFIFRTIKTGRFGAEIGKAALIVIVALVLNANVLGGLVLGKSPAGEVFTSFDHRHLEVFESAGHYGTSVYFNVLSLHGYWGEAEDRFAGTQNYNFLWKPLFLAIFALVLFGFWRGKKRNQMILPLTVIGLAAYILALGIAGSLTRPLAQFLYDHVPFYLGLREPQKWVGLLLISYVALGSLGVNYLLDYAKSKKYQFLLGTSLVLLVLAYTPTMFWGFWGQLQPADFPAEWYQAKEIIDKDPQTGRVLFLPWHQYPMMSFAGGKEITNPARSFFGSRTIQGDNMEMGGIFSQSSDPQSQLIEKYIAMKGEGEETDISALRVLGISYIILAKEDDYADYGWLEEQSSVKLIFEGDNLKLYQLTE
jgi:hypothetical protein